MKALKESLVSARTPLVATAAQNTASVLPSKHVFFQKNEDLFFRRSVLCFVRVRGNLFGTLATFLLYYLSKFFLPTTCQNSSSHVFPLTLSAQLVIFPFSHCTSVIRAESLQILMQFD